MNDNARVLNTRRYFIASGMADHADTFVAFGRGRPIAFQTSTDAKRFAESLINDHQRFRYSPAKSMFSYHVFRKVD